jgi:hypothetical protein
MNAISIPPDLYGRLAHAARQQGLNVQVLSVLMLERAVQVEIPPTPERRPRRSKQSVAQLRAARRRLLAKAALAAVG